MAVSQGRSVERSRLAGLLNRLPAPDGSGFRTTCLLAGASPWRGSKEKSCIASRCCRGVMRTGSLPLGGGCGPGRAGVCGGRGGGGRGGRCTVVAACRLSSLFTSGSFEAVKEFSCLDL